MSTIPRERSCSTARSESSMLDMVRRHFAAHHDLWLNNQDKLDDGRPDVLYVLNEPGVFDRYGWLEGKMVRIVRDRDEHKFASGLSVAQSFKLKRWAERHGMHTFMLLGIVDRMYLIPGTAGCVHEYAKKFTLDEYNGEAIFSARINGDGCAALRNFLVDYHKNTRRK